jgi:hypothetical protein
MRNCDRMTICTTRHAERSAEAEACAEDAGAVPHSVRRYSPVTTEAISSALKQKRRQRRAGIELRLERLARGVHPAHTAVTNPSRTLAKATQSAATTYDHASSESLSLEPPLQRALPRSSSLSPAIKDRTAESSPTTARRTHVPTEAGHTTSSVEHSQNDLPQKWSGPGSLDAKREPR